MKKLACAVVALGFLLCTSAAQGRSVEDYVAEASRLGDAGELKEAVELLAQALQEHPASSDIHAHLGLYTGMSAGRTADYMEAGRLSARSFELLDKAVSLDPRSPQAYLFRGIMGVRVPKFLGRLDEGINDLTKVVEMHRESPEAVSLDTLVTAYTMLADGHELNGDAGRARAALQEVIKLASGTDSAARARKRLGELPVPATDETGPLAAAKGDSKEVASLKREIEENPDDAAPILKLGKAYYAAGEFDEASEVLKRYVRVDSSNAEAYKLLGLAVARVAGRGYDEGIAEDTDLRSGLAFEAMNYMDKAVQLAPQDTELRLARGILGIMFPFFVGKHEQGVKDLEFVAHGDASGAQVSEALYYLGVAHQRQAMRYWREVASRYPGSGAARKVYGQMRPEVKSFDPSEQGKPVLAIDFVLGFQDELPPQTAVWVEDQDGNYQKTIYVSGFSGHAKDKQINLPVWAAATGFQGVDAVTGASIDVGRHIHTWDLRDRHGKRIERGTYTVKVETHFWPSMKYQLAEAAIELGKEAGTVVVEEGDFIPRLALSYYPESR